MSKTMEQASLTGGSPAGRIEHAMSAQEQDRKERRFGIKEIGILLAVSATLVGLIAYGVYSHGARATSRMASSTAQAPLTPASEAPVASAAAPSQPVQSPTTLQKTNPMPASREPAMDTKHADIYFDFGKSRLRADATAILQQYAGLLKNESHWAVLIQGYADQHGPAEYNRILALRRAESVKQFLVELGVPESSLKVASLGKGNTICDNGSPTCRRLNRRVHVEMIKLEAEAALPSIATTMEDTADLGPTSDHLGAPDSQANEEPPANLADQP